VLTLAANDSDRGLLAATRSLIDDPPDLLVVTTAVGFRAWVETADSAGCAGELLGALADTRIIARGPKALGAVRSAGLTCDWSAPSETSAEVIAHLMSGDVSGLRAAVQHHAGGSDGMTEALTGAGAQVVDLLIYRLGPPADPDGVRAAARSVAQGRFDAICFTSAMAVNAWLRVLDEERTTAAFLRRACDGELLVAAVGPVCAAPLRALDLRPLVPDRSRLGALVRVVADHYENEPGIATAAGVLHLRAGAAVLDGRVLPVTATGLDVLRLLADSPGAVVSRADVLGVLPGNSRGEHAAEVAVSRLRESCGESRLISTVVKRGYRLNLG
jgi:uroporphyrinogen-III synthase